MVREILAPLDGNVFQLHIKAGDQVEEDEEILVIFAPCDGIVREIRVKERDQVTENDVLAIIAEEHIEV